MALRQILFAEITRLYPDMKSKLAERYANKYCSAVLKELRSAVQRPHNDNEELSFNTTQTNIELENSFPQIAKEYAETTRFNKQLYNT